MNAATFTRTAARMVRRNDRLRLVLLLVARARRGPVARVPVQRRPVVSAASERP